MVYGDNRPYNVAIVVANVPAVQKWAATSQFSLSPDPEALLRDERVRTLVKGEIEKFGAPFKGFESIQDFVLIAQDFTTDNGMLTPSLKLKRRKVLEEYGTALDQLYAKRKGEGCATGTGARASAA
jgi:long-chain acyl-CoA synthetase